EAVIFFYSGRPIWHRSDAIDENDYFCDLHELGDEEAPLACGSRVAPPLGGVWCRRARGMPTERRRTTWGVWRGMPSARPAGHDPSHEVHLRRRLADRRIRNRD